MGSCEKVMGTVEEAPTGHTQDDFSIKKNDCTRVNKNPQRYTDNREEKENLRLAQIIKM